MQLSPTQARLVLLGAGLVIFALALQPAGFEQPTFLGLDKLKHIGAFVVLTGLAQASWPRIARWRLALGLAAFGVAIELAQGLTGWGRTASVADIVADCIGMGLGFALYQALQRWRVRRSSSANPAE